jgi:hypothetical protein
MVQRGRKSLQLTLIKTTPRVPGQGRPPGKGLPPAEARVWKMIVDAMPAGWFGPECQPILRCLVSHIVTTQVLAVEIVKAREAEDWDKLNQLTNIHEREGRSIADLSTKLRLTPRSKTSVERAANLRQVPPPPIRPWEITHK